MRSSALRILITDNSTWSIWNFRLPLVKSLLREGHIIVLLAPLDSHVAELEELGCIVANLKMDRKTLNPFANFLIFYRMISAFKSQRPDIILSFTIKNNIFGALAARSVGVPFVPNVTGLGTAFLSSGLLQKLAERLYRHSFANLPIVFFQNSDDKQLFVTRNLVRPDQVRLVPGSGIDLQNFAHAEMPYAHAPPVFLMIARLLRDKGVIEFVQAARQIKARHPNVRFQLLGAAGSENRTAIDASTVQAWVTEGAVEYLGTTDDVRPAIAAASCVVLPSYREGAPRTLIEAAAMARPLIATDVPGCRAVVDPDVTGFLCKARDADDLAIALERFLLLSFDDRKRMGQAGRAKMEREFDKVLVVTAYREALKTLTENR